MKRLLINTISTESTDTQIILSKALVKHFKSVELAFILSVFINEWMNAEREDFYCTISKLKDETFLSEGKIRTCIKKLIEANILIQKGLKGIPAKKYYNVNYDEVINILNCGESVYKKENDNPINEVENKDNNKDYEKIKNELKEEIKKEIEKEIREEIIKDIKEFKEKTREEIKKEVEKENVKEIKKDTRQKLREEALNLYEETKKTNPDITCYFDYADWQDWVDYKIKREKSLTILTFKRNIKQLMDYGVLAKRSITESIGSNWSGLFEPRKSYGKNKDFDVSDLMFKPGTQDKLREEWNEILERGYYLPKHEREKMTDEEFKKYDEENRGGVTW